MKRLLLFALLVATFLSPLALGEPGWQWERSSLDQSAPARMFYDSTYTKATGTDTLYFGFYSTRVTVEAETTDVSIVYLMHDPTMGNARVDSLIDWASGRAAIADGLLRIDNNAWTLRAGKSSDDAIRVAGVAVTFTASTWIQVKAFAGGGPKVAGP